MADDARYPKEVTEHFSKSPVNPRRNGCIRNSYLRTLRLIRLARTGWVCGLAGGLAGRRAVRGACAEAAAPLSNPCPRGVWRAAPRNPAAKKKTPPLLRRGFVPERMHVHFRPGRRYRHAGRISPGHLRFGTPVRRHASPGDV